VESYGGHAQRTNDLPLIRANWTAEVTTNAKYLADRTQLYVRLNGNRLEEVTNYLLQALGPLSKPATKSETGILHGYYTIGDIGVGLQFYAGNAETGLILVGTPRR
jgi:hypothetical protein